MSVGYERSIEFDTTDSTDEMSIPAVFDIMKECAFINDSVKSGFHAELKREQFGRRVCYRLVVSVPSE